MLKKPCCLKYSRSEQQFSFLIPFYYCRFSHGEITAWNGDLLCPYLPFVAPSENKCISISAFCLSEKIINSRQITHPKIKIKQETKKWAKISSSPIRLVLKGSWRFLRAPVEVGRPWWPAVLGRVAPLAGWAISKLPNRNFTRSRDNPKSRENPKALIKLRNVTPICISKHGWMWYKKITLTLQAPSAREGCWGGFWAQMSILRKSVQILRNVHIRVIHLIPKIGMRPS